MLATDPQSTAARPPRGGDLETRVLKGVSRSFYLTLRLLPAPMRGAASLGYLLARASDTIADTAEVTPDHRLAALESFRAAVAGETGRWTADFIPQVPDPRERRLLERCDLLLQWLRALPPAEATLVREVVAIIISGQALDLRRFHDASAARPVALADDPQLDDYAWRVAGCVGAFWTKLGILTLGPAFSTTEPELLLQRGIAYGKGLQLINILRDLPRDLAAGRCYLPVADPADRGQLLRAHADWLGRTRDWLLQGVDYARSLPSRRLRAATLLPALIASETIELLDGADWSALEARVKIPRRRVHLLLAKALLSQAPVIP
jgi:farnesyl-diphosphate farnesyltransferase